jgi:hypothetical protein
MVEASERDVAVSRRRKRCDVNLLVRWREAQSGLGQAPDLFGEIGLLALRQCPGIRDQVVDGLHLERRGRDQPEFELIDTGIFDDNRYFDIFVEYVQAAPDDILVKLTACNRGPDAARLDILPTLWFRNTWSWGRQGNGYWSRPSIRQVSANSARLEHETLGAYIYQVEVLANGPAPTLLFTDNESNRERLWGKPNQTRYVKDAFHRYLLNGERDAVNPAGEGTKVAAHYQFEIPAGGEQSVHVRFCAAGAMITSWRP